MKKIFNYLRLKFNNWLSKDMPIYDCYFDDPDYYDLINNKNKP